MGQTIERPLTFEVARQVLNVDQGTLDHIAAIAVAGHDMRGMRLKPLQNIRCVILGGGEVRAAAREAGVVLTEDDVEDLGDYVHDRLPESINRDFIDVPAPPLIMYKSGTIKHGRP